MLAAVAAVDHKAVARQVQAVQVAAVMAAQHHKTAQQTQAAAVVV
jgi:CMP-2-keto-3-deoxyoctulosonic acid synthetase